MLILLLALALIFWTILLVWSMRRYYVKYYRNMSLEIFHEAVIYGMYLALVIGVEGYGFIALFSLLGII